MDKPRRTYTPEFKVQMVLEIISGKKSLGEASREYGIKDSIAVILDVFTRAIRAWCLSRTLDQQLTLEAIKIALENGTSFIHQCYQGVQYAAYAYVDLLQAHEVQINMAVVGKAE